MIRFWKIAFLIVPCLVLASRPSLSSESLKPDVLEDSFSIFAGGPLYTGMEPMFEGEAAEYDHQRRKRVVEILDLADATERQLLRAADVLFALEGMGAAFRVELAQQLRANEKSGLSLNEWRFVKDFNEYFASKKSSEADTPLRGIMEQVRLIIQKKPDSFDVIEPHLVPLSSHSARLGEAMAKVNRLRTATPEMRRFKGAQLSVLGAFRIATGHLLKAIKTRDNAAFQNAMAEANAAIEARKKLHAENFPPLKQRALKTMKAAAKRFGSKEAADRHFAYLESQNDIPSWLDGEAGTAMRDVSVTTGMLMAVRAADDEEVANKDVSADAVASTRAYQRIALLHKGVVHLGKHLTEAGLKIARIIVIAEQNPEIFENAAAYIKAFSTRYDEKFKDALNKYNGAMQGLLAVNDGIQSLKAADFALMKHFLETSRAQLPRLKEIADNLKPRPGFSGDAIAASRDFNVFLAKLTDGLGRRFDGMNPKVWKKADAGFEIGIVRSAYAAESWFSRSISKLTTPLKGMAGRVTSSVGSTLSAVKRGATSCITSPLQCSKKVIYKVASTGANVIVKGVGMTKQAVLTIPGVKRGLMAAGYALDKTNKIAKDYITVASDLYYGPKEVWDPKTKSVRKLTFKERLMDSLDGVSKTYKADHDRINENYRKGRPGADILKGAVTQLENFEDYVGETTSSTVEKGTGGFGVTSWAAGGIAKVGAGMLTGFGKGMLTMVNPDSTDQQVALGGLDVGLSLVGGANSVMKPSQALKLNKTFASRIFKSGKDLLSKSLKSIRGAKTLKAAGKARKVLTQIGGKKMEKVLVDNAKKMSAKYVELLKAEAKSAGKFKRLMGKAAKSVKNTVAKNMGDAAKGAGEFVLADLGSGLKGVANSLLKAITGEGIETLVKEGAKSFARKVGLGLFDNVLAGFAENQFKDWFLPKTDGEPKVAKESEPPSSDPDKTADTAPVTQPTNQPSLDDIRNAIKSRNALKSRRRSTRQTGGYSGGSGPSVQDKAAAAMEDSRNMAISTRPPPEPKSSSSSHGSSSSSSSSSGSSGCSSC